MVSFVVVGYLPITDEDDMTDIINYVGMGGTVLILLSVFIEIVPCKINPIQWLGSRFNAGIKKDVDKINTKLDEHIAQSYRSKILNFQSKLIDKGISGHSQEEWKEVINACENYETYIKENKLSNGLCEIAIEFIKESYKECLKTGSFANIVTTPTKK